MVGSGHVAKGAIYSKAGDSAWAQSSGFDVRSFLSRNRLSTQRHKSRHEHHVCKALKDKHQGHKRDTVLIIVYTTGQAK